MEEEIMFLQVLPSKSVHNSWQDQKAKQFLDPIIQAMEFIWAEGCPAFSLGYYFRAFNKSADISK